MKHLTVTFGLAVGIICSVVIYNKVQSNVFDMQSAKVAKTIVETDSEGRVISELTMVISGNRWVEESKRVISYAHDYKIEAVYEHQNDVWVEQEKIISSYYNNSLIKTVSYTLTENEKWVESSKKSFDDLSYDDGTMHDMVFDKDGNLIMSATYKWDEGENIAGVEKNEYVYNNNGMPSRQISYNWDGKEWRKAEVADLLYVSQKIN